MIQYNHKGFWIEYSIEELLRRATRKITLYDRSLPSITSGGFGAFPELVKRWRRLTKWKNSGIAGARVYYTEDYYVRNAHTPHIMDPLHTFSVLRYSPIG